MPRAMWAWWWAEAGLACAWGAAALWGLSDVAPGLGVTVVVAAGGLALAASAAVRLVCLFGLALRLDLRFRRAAWSLALWPVTACIGLGGVLAAASDADLRLRVWASERELRDAAADALAMGGAPGHGSGARRIGLFRVEDVDAGEGWVRFRTGANLIDPYGLYYAPDGPPEDRAWLEETRHVRGPWWAFEEH